MNDYYGAVNDYRGYLIHYGILGMRWGVRRYQNPDGSLTEAGRKRYQQQVTEQARKEVKEWRTSRGYSDGNTSAYKPSDSLKNKLREGADKKKVEELRALNEKLINFSKNIEPSIADFEESEEYNDFLKDVHKETLKTLKEWRPKTYEEVINDKDHDFDYHHDYRKLYEGFLDEMYDEYENKWKEKHKNDQEYVKQKNIGKEWDKTYDQYLEKSKELVDDLFGPYKTYALEYDKFHGDFKADNEADKIGFYFQYALPDILLKL